ncbi:hypothetical protein B0F90DRAFT_1704613 [Multifurca ochricompacta]|uniref:Xylanolytic transcriptional activator regulatory domain-containing protein n=1 Tax=Multifurca ochricompacta TaxID=376703 RepID=A0AAD4QQ80_9AGAM|nr:hypothetical protein B0F90DRAFT_1704613 [Multifurca ochricompacta]
MNRHLERRVKILEEQLAFYTSCPVNEVAQNAIGLALSIPDLASPSFGGHPSPASTQSEPVLPKTEEQMILIKLSPPRDTFTYAMLAPNTPEHRSFNEEVVNGSADAYRSLSQENSVLNPEIDWARHLPQDVPLTQLEHDRLLDLLFRFFASWGLPCQIPPAAQTAHYSPMLHNALLAVATAFSDDPTIKDPVSRRRFADKAKSCLEDECELPKLSAMTALSILANYHSSENHPTLGYIYFGISARMSQALGLGIDCSPWVEAGLITHAGMLDRNWALWATFCQDTTWSLYVGRNFSTTSYVDSQTIPVPFVSPDLDQFLGIWPPDENDRPNHISATFAATCSLMQIARDIANVVLKLSTWKNDLFLIPQPHQLMLHMTYHWLAILLHRPFYRRRRSYEDIDDNSDHIKTCNRAAAEIMELAGLWRRHFTLRYVPITLIQVVSAAATIFVVAAVQAVSGPRVAYGALELSEKNAETAIQYLREVGESFACATSIADILQNLLQEQVQTRKARRSPGSSPRTIPGFSACLTASGINTEECSWMEATGRSASVGHAHAHTDLPNLQPIIGYPSCQYSSLAEAMGTPLSYHQPFGDGLGESPCLPAGVTFPAGMNIGSILRGDTIFSTDSFIHQEPFYAPYHPPTR